MHHYYHEVLGRVRVKSPLLKGDHLQCRALEESLAREAGVQAVSANPVTGSVVVNYDPELANSKAVLGLLARRGYFHPERAVTADRHLATSAEKVGHLVGKALLGAVVKQVFEGSALSLISALL